MDKIARIRQEIERLYDGEAPKHDQQCDFDDGYFTGIGAIYQFLDALSEESDKDLEEAADNFAPDNWMLMGKINELIEAVNRLEKKIEKLQVL